MAAITEPIILNTTGQSIAAADARSAAALEAIVQILRNGGGGGGGSGSGTDGYSPTVTITDITGGHRVTITDVNGAKTFDVLDGSDGISPTVSVFNITGGHRVNITDATGTKGFSVMDGVDSSGPTYSSVVPEQTFTPTADGTRITFTNLLVAGETYRYVVNGTETTGTATEAGSAVILGVQSEFADGTGGIFECVNNVIYYDTKLRTPITLKVDKVVANSSGYNPLRGKIAAFTGDSLCEGPGFTGGYARIIGEDNSMTVQNIGVSEGTIVRYRTRFCISESIPDLREDADYVILEGGLNDAWYGQEVIPLGSLSNGYDATLDRTTFAGAFEYMIKTALERFPAAKIGYIFPHKVADNFNAPNGPYRLIAISALEKWGIPYKDFNVEIPPINQIDALKAIYVAADETHPNEAGYRTFYAGQMAEWMKTL